VSFYNFPAGILLCGVLSHFFFFAFALLPADQKSQTPPSMLYAEDRVFLTLSLTLNFAFKSYYVYFKYEFCENKVQSFATLYRAYHSHIKLRPHSSLLSLSFIVHVCGDY
jgi:hypothetical protein